MKNISELVKEGTMSLRLYNVLIKGLYFSKYGKLYKPIHTATVQDILNDIPEEIIMQFRGMGPKLYEELKSLK